MKEKEKRPPLRYEADGFTPIFDIKGPSKPKYDVSVYPSYFNEDGTVNYDKFIQLPKEIQEDEMKDWEQKQHWEYMNQEPYYTDEEVWGPIFENLEKYHED